MQTTSQTIHIKIFSIRKSVTVKSTVLKPGSFMSDAEIADMRDCVVADYGVEPSDSEVAIDWPYREDAGQMVKGKLHTW